MDHPSRWPDEPVPPGFVLAAGTTGLFVATVAAMAAHRPTHQALLMLTLVAAAASIRTTIPVAVCLGVFAWLFLTGFVVNDLGELRVHGGEDWLRLVVLLGSTWLVAHATRPPRGAVRVEPGFRRHTKDR